MVKPKSIKLNAADIARFWEKVDWRGLNECWEWAAGCNPNGYGIFQLNGSAYFAHRIAFVVANGDTELHVLHTCDNPPCCNPKHLFAGTPGDNQRDSVDKGRAADRRGEDNGRAKLTESDVREIRRLHAGGWLLREIVDEYGISKLNVSRICSGKRWKHLGGLQR